MDKAGMALCLFICLSIFVTIAEIKISEYVFATLQFLAIISPVLLAFGGMLIIVAIELSGDVGFGGRLAEFVAGAMCLVGFVLTTDNSRL